MSATTTHPAIKLTRNPREAFQFRNKAEAIKAAKSIGWQANDAQRVTIMGFQIWVIGDEHGNFVTRDSFETAHPPVCVSASDIALALFQGRQAVNKLMESSS